ncbi:MAG: GGDEF domain-containing protein [bacterium]|nr:GGDEF domain-containing protein [bacterium]
MKLKRKKTKIGNIILKILIGLLILGILGVAVYYFLTAEDEDNNLTLLEKQWIESNKSVLVDIDIPNNTYIYSNSGEGVLFDFLDYVKTETGLEFNKKPYNYKTEEEFNGLSVVVLDPNSAIKQDDIIILEDNYVLLGQEEGYLNDLEIINGTTVGILENDSNYLKSFFTNKYLTYKSYNSITNLLKDLKDNKVSFVIIPRYSYLNDIIDQNVFVKYVISDLSNKYVLRLGTNEKLNNIIIKLLENYKSSILRLDYEENLFNFYSKKYELTEISKSTLVSKVYKYGYIKNTSYNVLNNNKIYGVAGEYINSIVNMTDMEFDYIAYDNINDLKKALDTGKLDLAFIDGTYDNENYLKTVSSFSEEFTALSNVYQDISNKYGLINNKLYLKNNNSLYDYVSNNISSSIKTVENYESKISDDGIILLDKTDYLYLKDSKLKNYKYLFTDNYNGNKMFVVKQSDDVLYNLLNFTLNNTNSLEYEMLAINNLLEIQESVGNFKGIYMIVVAIILCPIIIGFLVILIMKNSKNLKITKKENILKYNDMLTNLKNRNYLNDNIEKWDNTKVYPRTIVIIDLNNLKYVNDNYGHEAGNELIKKAAAILINTQLEKSDIIRTDGNEFLIYLLGYSKTQINAYLSKLSKEFEKLPYGFGAAIGYSMINDEITTIDDAINEATIEMRMDKEKNYR